MAPPLRTSADQDALWAALKDGRIATVGTDHCPFNLATKVQAGTPTVFNCPGGIPGIELRLALLYSEGVIARGLDLHRFVDACCTAPARVFGLGGKKGSIAVGLDADLVLFDPARTRRVTHSQLHERVDYTPYEGLELTGYPVATIRRGSIIAKDGKRAVSTPGAGQYLFRTKEGRTFSPDGKTSVGL